MTQDAGIKVAEQGAWLEINVGTADAPKMLRLKLIPADFEQMNAINSKIIALGKPKGKDGAIEIADNFAAEVVRMIAPFVVDWNLIDDEGKIDPTEENKRKQLGRLLIAYAAPEAKEGEAADTKPERQTVLNLIMSFIGDYSNFLQA